MKQPLDAPVDYVAKVSLGDHLELAEEEGVPSLVSSPVSDALPKGQLSSDSFREIVAASAPLGFQCSIPLRLGLLRQRRLRMGG